MDKTGGLMDPRPGAAEGAEGAAEGAEGATEGAAEGNSMPCVCCGTEWNGNDWMAMRRKDCKLEQEIADFFLDNPLKWTREACQEYIDGIRNEHLSTSQPKDKDQQNIVVQGNLDLHSKYEDVGKNKEDKELTDKT